MTAPTFYVAGHHTHRLRWLSTNLYSSPGSLMLHITRIGQGAVEWRRPIFLWLKLSLLNQNQSKNGASVGSGRLTPLPACGYVQSVSVTPRPIMPLCGSLAGVRRWFPTVPPCVWHVCAGLSHTTPQSLVCDWWVDWVGMRRRRQSVQALLQASSNSVAKSPIRQMRVCYKRKQI